MSANLLLYNIENTQQSLLIESAIGVLFRGHTNLRKICCIYILLNALFSFHGIIKVTARIKTDCGGRGWRIVWPRLKDRSATAAAAMASLTNGNFVARP